MWCVAQPSVTAFPSFRSACPAASSTGTFTNRFSGERQHRQRGADDDGRDGAPVVGPLPVAAGDQQDGHAGQVDRAGRLQVLPEVAFELVPQPPEQQEDADQRDDAAIPEQPFLLGPRDLAERRQDVVVDHAAPGEHVGRVRGHVGRQHRRHQQAHHARRHDLAQKIRHGEERAVLLAELQADLARPRPVRSWPAPRCPRCRE